MPISSSRRNPTTEPFVTFRDFTEYSRNERNIQTTIRIYDDINLCYVDWIRCGEVVVQPNDRERTDATIKARFGNDITDQEHDSALIFSFDVVGLRLSGIGVDNGHTWLEAVIARCSPRWGTFKISKEGYDPLANAKICTESREYCCRKKGHKYIERFVPEHNQELYSKLVGCKIEIITGPKFIEESKED